MFNVRISQMFAAVAGNVTEMDENFGSWPKWNESSGINEHHGVQFDEGKEFCQVRQLFATLFL